MHNKNILKRYIEFHPSASIAYTYTRPLQSLPLIRGHLKSAAVHAGREYPQQSWRWWWWCVWRNNFAIIVPLRHCMALIVMVGSLRCAALKRELMMFGDVWCSWCWWWWCLLIKLKRTRNIIKYYTFLKHFINEVIIKIDFNLWQLKFMIWSFWRRIISLGLAGLAGYPSYTIVLLVS